MDAAPPPAWESAAFKADREAFANTQQSLTDADRALAKKWAGGAGSVTPPGLWLQIAGDLIARDNLDTHQAANVYATLSVAMHDSFIACWHSKYRYLLVRPVTWMRETDPKWLPYIDTPPFPSYPSGHATVSATASTILAAFFPHDAGQFHQWAEDATRSRIVGGIHWPLDGRAGLDQGRAIGSWILAHPPASRAVTSNP
jgi:membrane-associated phospholipid phosphatase